MGAHVYHQDLPGYLEFAVYQDGCPECEKRAHRPFTALLDLDDRNLIRIWVSMIAKEYDNEGIRLSRLDHRLCDAAYRSAILMERWGIDPRTLPKRLERVIAASARLVET